MAQRRHTDAFLDASAEVIRRIDRSAIDAVVDELIALRSRDGRLFIVGSGGGAGHASHAVCDFRKLGGFEAYAPSDNVAELTARINDDGWESSYAEWLRGSRICDRDLLLVFSVGGGDVEMKVSLNLVRCIDLARTVGARVCGIVGRDGGYTAQVADACVIVPTTAESVTAQTESFQALLWHLLVSHPDLQQAAMKWESLTA